MRSALLAAQTSSNRGHKLDSETHLAMPTSRRGQNLPPLTEDTMPDSGGPVVQVGASEVDLEATHYDNQQLAFRGRTRRAPAATPRIRR